MAFGGLCPFIGSRRRPLLPWRRNFTELPLLSSRCDRFASSMCAGPELACHPEGVPSFITLEATTKLPRNEAIQRVMAALVADGGFVTGTESLGGMALVFRIELTQRALQGLPERLFAAGARLDEANRAQLERERAMVDPDVEHVGSLLLRFYASEPDLKLEIPKVPG